MSRNNISSNMSSQKKERIGWYFYDFANSAFATTVTTVFLGPFLTSVASAAANDAGNIPFLWFEIAAGSYFPFIVSLSVAIQVFLLPLIGSIADNTKYKKHLLFLTTYIGSLSTLGFYFVTGTNYALGGALFVIANINFGAACVVYNSYLSYVAGEKSAETVSSMGWAYGYIGGGILLLLNLYFFSNAEHYGISTELSIRICLASAGLWWGLFALITFFTLRNSPNKPHHTTNNILSHGFTSLIKTIKEAKNYPQTLIFLLSYMFYNDGVQAVIVLAAQFGNAEIGLTMDTLITVILIIQFVAFFGSLFFGYLAKKTNPLLALKISIVIWILVIFYAYFFLYTKLDFYIMGIVVGIVLGGTQAISRSIYSQIIPIGKEAEYFSIYEVSEKGTSWLAPFLFGLIYNFTNSYRTAIISIVLFFIIGIILLLKFDFIKAKQKVKVTLQ